MSKARELANLGNAYSDGALSNRRINHNGAMQVAQRGTSFTGWANSAAYSLDRFKYTNYQSGTVTISQDSNAPIGFSKSLKIATTATDSGASTYSFLQQFIEGQDVASLAYGTVSPKQVTASFWIKSNMTGTYTFNISTYDSARRIASTYTVNSADTWEYKTITFVGDSSSSIAYDNTLGLICEWWFAASSAFTTNPLPTSWTANSNLSRSTGLNVGINTSTSNYVNITGVQLEVGDTATPFEHRSYGEELALCKRYFQTNYNTDGNWIRSGTVSSSATGNRESIPFMSEMRSVPTITATYDSLINIATGYPYVGQVSTQNFNVNVYYNTSGAHFRYAVNYQADAEL